jgi:hypothetical protein
MKQRARVRTPKPRGLNHWFVPCGARGFHVRWISWRYRCGCNTSRRTPYLACQHIAAVRRIAACHLAR